MIVPLRTLPDPCFYPLDFCRSQTLPRCGWWHRMLRIRGANSQDEFTLFRVAKPDQRRTVRGAENSLGAIQPQARLTLFLIRTVTLGADPVQQRADLTAEIDRLSNVFCSPDRRRLSPENKRCHHSNSADVIHDAIIGTGPRETI